MPVYYWRGIIAKDATLFAPYMDVINRFLHKEWHGLHVEKLRGWTEPMIGSVRVNQTDRILWTTVDGKLCLLDVILNHEYEKSRFLKKGVLSAFLNKLRDNESTLDALEFVDLDAEELPLPPQAQNDDAAFIGLEPYQHRLIQLNTEQEDAVLAQLPLIAYGPAGSGKSCVAFSMLSNYVREQAHDKNAFPIVYISQSLPLVNSMQTMWQETGAEENYPGQVLFKTYDQILQEEMNGGKLADETTFSDWYSNRMQQPAIKLKQKRSEEHITLSPDLVWREFRICSGYSKEEYLGLGQRQSAIKPELRAFLYDTYDDFLKYLDANGLVSPALHHFTHINTHYPLVVVDEAQDFSYRQLQNLHTLAIRGNIAYFLGDHQV
uniref:hypothetical protein n=1 Tax=Legionella yabuuchiae TaxID=376727 RepID=UPI001054F175